MKNILLALHGDPNIELIEAANGFTFGADLKTPWESFGTYPNDPSLLARIRGDQYRERAATYGFYTIDEIVKKSRPDVYLGIEDIWAFCDFQKKSWWGKIPSIIWTTLDSLPILEQANQMAPKCSKFFVWATFAEEEMRKNGYEVKTIHGVVDYNKFYRLPENQIKSLRSKLGLEDNFVIGFVFKNQLRKSAPNLLEGFRLFKEANPRASAKLLLHTDWAEKTGLSWDLPKYTKEKGVDPNDVLATYVCKKCKSYELRPYTGEDLACESCGGENTLSTKNYSHGCSESQLNEIYNVMDVYCHPFTSGGQELPIQEAKAAGKITLVTNYSCGTDSIGGKTGGLPLGWTEYREPGSDFIKATTLPASIAEQIEAVYKMDPLEKKRMESEAANYVSEKYSVASITNKLKKELLEFEQTSWDFNMEFVPYNLDYVPAETEDDEAWLIDLYEGVAFKRLKHNDPEITVGKKLIAKDGRGAVETYLKTKAKERNETNKPVVNFEDLLDKEGKENRIAVVIPESAGDVLMVNALIKNLSELYNGKNIYVFTKPEYFDMINDNPCVHKLLPYQDGVDNLLFLEGKGDHEGFFKCAFLPFVGSQRILNYLHNGSDKCQFELKGY